MFALLRIAGNESFFAAADADNSNGLSASEMLAAMPPGVQGAVDADGDGVLTEGEVSGTTHPFMRAVADLDGSGVVEAAEASAFFDTFAHGTASLTGDFERRSDRIASSRLGLRARDEGVSRARSVAGSRSA